MKSTQRVTGDIPHVAIGYKYRFQKVLGFIAKEGGGSNVPGWFQPEKSTSIAFSDM